MKKFIVFMVLLAISGAATACSCVPLGTTAQEYQKSDLVVKGKVLAIDAVIITEATKLKRGWRFWKPRFEYSTHEMLRAKVLVEKGFKGSGSDTIYVFTNNQIAACGYPFATASKSGGADGNGEYMVFAMGLEKTSIKYSLEAVPGKTMKIDRSTHFVTGLCMATQKANAAEEGRLTAIAKEATTK